MRILNIVIVCLLTAAQLPAIEGPREERESESESGERARLEQAVLLLDDAEASNRHSAVQVIVHQAGRGATMSDELRLLLLRATADPEPEIAALAARALDRRAYPPKPETRSDDEVRASADADRLKWAQETLSLTDPVNRSAADRLAAVNILVHLASRRGGWSADLEWLVRELRQDDDFEMAHLAEKALAHREARAIHPDLAWPETPSQEPPSTGLEYPTRAEAMFAGAGSPDPQERLSSLHWVVDIALAEGAGSDPRILDTLIAHSSDPDPRIASFVRFALDGLAGDENAMREVVDRSPVSGGSN